MDEVENLYVRPVLQSIRETKRDNDRWWCENERNKCCKYGVIKRYETDTN